MKGGAELGIAVDLLAFDKFRCNLLFDASREARTRAGLRGHQLMVFAEVGIKLLIGQSQGDLRPRPRSESVKRLSNIWPPPSKPCIQRFLASIGIRSERTVSAGAVPGGRCATTAPTAASCRPRAQSFFVSDSSRSAVDRPPVHGRHVESEPTWIDTRCASREANRVA